MPATYRGEIRVQGRNLRGWLANVGAPAERVVFSLLIDGEERGVYAADHPHAALERYTAFGDGAHGFIFSMDRDWITGEAQTVGLAVDGVPTDVELHAPLGPAAKAFFGEAPEGTPGAASAANLVATVRRDLVELRARRRSASDAAERARIEEQYIGLLTSLSAGEGEDARRYSLHLARELHDSGRFLEAVQVAARVLVSDPDNFPALMAKGRSLVALNRAGETRDLFERALALEPQNASARLFARIANTLGSADAPSRPLTVGTVGWNAADGEDPLAQRLARLPFDWVRFAAGSAEEKETPPQVTPMLNDALLQQCGCARAPSPDGEVVYWRREALIALADSGLLTRLDENALAHWAPFFVSPAERRALGAADATRKVALISRHGAVKFGGGEHFLADVAQHYTSTGYEPVIVGMSPDAAIERGTADGIAYAFVDETAAALRRFCLEENIQLVHAISLGYVVADALALTNIPFVYGVHFWADALKAGHDKQHFDRGTGAPRVRPEFNYILSRAAAVYANSEYTQDVIEECFDVRCPVVYSVPREIA